MLKKQEIKKEARTYNSMKKLTVDSPARSPDHVLYVKNAYAGLGK